jgi:hypothetical protein
MSYRFGVLLLLLAVSPCAKGVDARTAAAPAGLTAVKAPNAWNSVQLNWKSSSGTYSVFRGATPGGEAPQPIAANLPAPAFTDNGLVADTTYYYKVKAINVSGASGDSNEVSYFLPAPLYRDQASYPPYSLTWTTYSDLLQVRGVYPHLFLQRRALVATDAGLLLSDDEGRTWINLPAAAVEKVGPISGIVFHPVLADTFYITSQTKGVWITSDNGKTFTQVGSKSNGMAADAVTSLIVYPADSTHQTLLATHGDAAPGLSCSRNGGQSWHVVNPEYHFRRIFGAEGNRPLFYLFGSTLAEPDIPSVYTCNTVGEYVNELVRDVVGTDLVFAPVPWRQNGVTYLATSDSGLYRIDNSSPFGMAYDVEKIPYPGLDGWASVGVTWGPTADSLNLFLYDPTKLGLLLSSEVLSKKPAPPRDLSKGLTVSEGLPVTPLAKEGAVLRPNANGTLCYAVANGALSVGRMPEDVPVVDFTPAGFDMKPNDSSDWRDLGDAFGRFCNTRGSLTDAAKALCREVPGLENLYHRSQITVSVRVPIKPSPPKSVTIDLSRYGGLPDTPLYDDGRHDDGAAGDGIYGLTFIFLPGYHSPSNEAPDWRVIGPGHTAIGVVATYPDGRRRGAVGVVNYSQQLLDLPMWNEGLDRSLIVLDGGVTADVFRNPLLPGQPDYAPRLHHGDIAVRLHLPKGPWTVHFNAAYNRHDINGYPGLSFFARAEGGEAPKELYLQLRDAPEFSPPTTTDRVPLLHGITLGGSYQRIAVSMSQALGPTAPLQTDHLAEIMISGESTAPGTLVIDALTAIPVFPPPTPSDPAQ